MSFLNVDGSKKFFSEDNLGHAHPESLGLLGAAISEEIGLEQHDSQCTYLQRLAALAFG